MSDAAITHKPGSSNCRTRGVSPDAVHFAKGVLIGVIVVMSLWLLFG